MVLQNFFLEISVIVAIAVVVSFVVRFLRQPLIVGYIITGILVSPYFLDLVKSVESIETFSKMGVAILLFMVGLNLDPKVTRHPSGEGFFNGKNKYDNNKQKCKTYPSGENS